jgi:hypothetical protein
VPSRSKIWRTQRVSEFYGIDANQGDLDFIDVDVVADTRLFVDPRALRILAETDQWALACCELLRDFFDCVLQVVKAGDETKGLELLRGLREPNDTRLGLSRKEADGNAIGRKLAKKIWNNLAKSEAAHSGLLEDLEDSALLIERIATDRISDITTNVIRGPLIAFTQEMCEKYPQITAETVPAGLIWDDDDHCWLRDVREDLPVPRGRPLLLVPKSILRAKLDFDPGDYYGHAVNWLQGWELGQRNSELLEILKNGRSRITKKRVTEKYRNKYGKELGMDLDKEPLPRKDFSTQATLEHPQILESYRKEKDLPGRRSTPPTYTEIATLTGGDPPDFSKLLKAVVDLKSGKAKATAYHRAIKGLFDVLFWPELQFGEAEVKTHGGRKRLDIRYVNTREGSGFFSWLADNYGDAPHVIVECKNYAGDPANPELDQLLGRFARLEGKVGILTCRQFSDKQAFVERCSQAAKGGQGFAIPLDDEDIQILAEARLADNADQFKELLFDRFHELTD